MHSHDLRLVQHLESYLGTVRCGWKELPDGQAAQYQVVEYEGLPTISGSVAYSTLGLSDVPLPPLPRTGQLIRHELVFLARKSFGRRNIPGLLQQVAQEALIRNRAYLCGDVIGPRGALFDESTLEALYVTNPVYLPDDFAACTLPTGEVAVIAWLVPITRSESEYVRSVGWRRFEDTLVAVDPDLLDFNRKSVV